MDLESHMFHSNTTVKNGNIFKNVGPAGIVRLKTTIAAVVVLLLTTAVASTIVYFVVIQHCDGGLTGSQFREKEETTLFENLGLTTTGEPISEHINIAVKKPTWHIPVFSNRTADKANDGSRDPFLLHNSCSNTKRANNPWWIVDLDGMYTISYVTLATPKQPFDYRLQNFTVEVSGSMSYSEDFSSFAVCNYYPGVLERGAILNLTCTICTPVRFVKIQMFEEFERLILCEVEIYPAGHGQCM